MAGLHTKHEAQRRADQIAAFRAEVDQLAREGVPLDGGQLDVVAAHHEAMLRRISREFDVDRYAAGRRMSAGMRAASLVGAAALTAAVVSFVSRVWGVLPTAGQVALLTVAPVAAVALMSAAGRLEKTRYLASLCAIVATGTFVLQTVMLATLFNLRGSPHVLALWAVFAFAVAVPWRFGVPFAFGVLALVAYPPAIGFSLAGIPWTHVVERPEPAAALAAVALLGVHRLPAELERWARAILLIVALGTVLVTSATAAISLLPLGDRAVTILYQVVAVMAACATLAGGLRRAWPEIVAIGSIFTALFLLIRFVDWWWDWMPRYLFFLIVAAVALAWLWGLRAARRALTGATA